MFAAYAQPTLDRSFRGVHLQPLAIAVGTALASCLLLSWPLQWAVAYPLARAGDWSTAGDRLGDYTTSFVLPVILAGGTWLFYRVIVSRLTVHLRLSLNPDRLGANERSRNGSASMA